MGTENYEKEKSSENIETKIKVLFVDDDERIRNLFELKITSHNFQVITCGTVKEAIEFLEKIPGIGILICDMDIGGESGIEVVKKAIKISPEIVVIGISGNYGSKKEFFDSGASYFFSKPFSPAELIKVLEDIRTAKK